MPDCEACGVGAAEPGPGVFLGASRGLCRECGSERDVRYVADDGGVFLERLCPVHGKRRTLVAETLAWYLDATSSPPAARSPATAVRAHDRPCPRSCGPCAMHAQRCNLPVFSITNACELRCPICFTFNRSDAVYLMSPEEMDRHLDYVVQSTGGVDLVNITGGEPTCHPQLLRLLERARRPGIGRVTMNTNGLRLARDPELADALAKLGIYVIMSLDTLDPAVSVRVHGRDICAEKRAALANLERAGVQTTLLTVLIGGVNEDELGAITELAFASPVVRSLTVQTMTYTGQGGGSFMPRRHIPVEGVERRLERSSAGAMKSSDFVPLPTAHPLCYGVAYYLMDEEGRRHPMAGILDRHALARHLADGYLLHPSGELEQDLKAAIDRLWSIGGQDALLAAMKGMLRSLYPSGTPLSVHERQRRAEQMVKTVYVHAHMDEDTFEVGRAMRCPDQVPVHAERLIGACSYNLFYRRQDPRFWVEP